MGKEKEDVAWQHCVKIDGNRMKVMCNYCNEVKWGGISRFKNHIVGSHKDVKQCLQCPDDVREMFSKTFGLREKENIIVQDDEECFEVNEEGENISGKKGSLDKFVLKGSKKSKQKTMNEMLKDREPIVRSICRMLYKNALPFNLVKCPLFKEMLEKVGNYGRGLKPPTFHEARVSYLKNEVKYVHDTLEKYKKEWRKIGCTIMSDGWTDGQSRHLTNFLVNSPSGTVFLKSLDTSSIIKDGEKLFEMLDSIVEEVGEESVVQVVTDGASAYVRAGELLEEKRPKIFWSPCAAHCIDLILEDIGKLPVFLDTIKKAKEVTVYIYRHAWVLDLFRKFSKQRNLTRAGVTRFATSFLTLKSFMDNKNALKKMFVSDKWTKGPYASKTDAKKVEGILLHDSKFWKSVKYCLNCVSPLCKVLRLVDGDLKPAMGYIYEAMDRAKEQIANNFNNNQSSYKRIWEIINLRWNMQLHRPLHAAGYFLNPRFQYDEKFKADLEVKLGLYTTIERLYPDLETRLKIDEQIEKFRRAEGMFGMRTAKDTITRKQPGLWWESFGEECKELQQLAIRVLSLTCSATGCERNWSIFDLVRSKRRNRLEQQRLNSLVFVKYNIQLELRQKIREEKGDTYDPICLSDMEDNDEWITEVEEPCLLELGDTSWMDIHECFKETSTSKKRKRGPRDLRVDRKGKQKVVEIVDDEDEEEFDDVDEEEEEEEGGMEEEEADSEESDENDFDDLDIDEDEDN